MRNPVSSPSQVLQGSFPGGRARIQSSALQRAAIGAAGAIQLPGSSSVTWSEGTGSLPCPLASVRLKTGRQIRMVGADNLPELLDLPLLFLHSLNQNRYQSGVVKTDSILPIVLEGDDLRQNPTHVLGD